MNTVLSLKEIYQIFRQNYESYHSKIIRTHENNKSCVFHCVSTEAQKGQT